MNTLHRTVIRRRPQKQHLLFLAEAFRAHDPNEGGELLMPEFLDHRTFPTAYSMDMLNRAQCEGLVELVSRSVCCSWWPEWKRPFFCHPRICPCGARHLRPQQH